MAGHIRIIPASAFAALCFSSNALAHNVPQQELETVIVTGVRESIVQGLENKREAVQVVESIVAEDIGKLPDNEPRRGAPT